MNAESASFVPHLRYFSALMQGTEKEEIQINASLLAYISEDFYKLIKFSIKLSGDFPENGVTED